MRYIFCLLLLVTSTLKAESEALYLANAGVLVRHNDTKILFDPLFRNNYGQYLLLPADVEKDLMLGAPPFDGVDAVFVSHFHGDHFAPREMLDYLRAQPGISLYAPQQAVAELTFFIDANESSLEARIHPVDIDYGEPARVLQTDGLVVEAFHIPHSGWPDRTPEVQNLAFRVTLDNAVTVLHMGDADTRTEHFDVDRELWTARSTDMAFPPFWYFLSDNGQRILGDRLQPAHAVGVHVPVTLDEDLEKRLSGYDLFRNSGESRRIAASPR